MMRVCLLMSTVELFSIATGSVEPIYRQLVEQVRRFIASGRLCAGDEMPSVRELANALAVNPMTVSKAFNRLEAEGFLERRRGLAMVVSARHWAGNKSAPNRQELLLPALQSVAVQARELGLEPEEVLALFKSVLESSRCPTS